jgi:heterotetrameric sarcosine oxidase delta subunit
MLILTCPNCGPRNVSEFHFGGEYRPRPQDPSASSDATWANYLYLRNNTMGVQTEWWYHKDGCGLWFLAERHTRTNEIIKTYLWQSSSVTGEAERANWTTEDTPQSPPTETG